MLKNKKTTVGACCLGYMSSAIANNLAPLFFIIFQNRFGIGYDRLSALVFINFGVQFFMDFISAKFVDKIGYRASAVAASSFVFTGLVCLSVLPSVMENKFAAILISIIFYAVGAGIIEVIVNPIVEYTMSDRSNARLSLLHSFYCWGQASVILISTLLLGFFGENFWNKIPLLWALLPLFNVFLFSVVPMEKPIPEEKKKTFSSMFKSFTFILILLMMTLAGAAEITMTQWSSMFAETALGVNKTLGDIFGPCLFAVIMGIGRILYCIWGNRFSMVKILLFSSIGCICCYITVGISNIPYLSLFACALTGLFVSCLWTGMLNIAAEKYPSGGTPMWGMLALFGDIGCAVGPTVSGLVSDFAENTNFSPVGEGLKVGISFAVIFPLLLLLCLILFSKRTSSKKLK